MRSAGTVSEFVTASVATTACATEHSFHISIGGIAFTFQTCCETTMSGLRKHFGHLSGSSKNARIVTFFDAEHVHSQLPQITWNWTSTTHRDEGGTAYFLDFQEAILAHDTKEQRFVIATRAFTSQDFSRREILRLLLQPVFSSVGLDVLHGATIGTENRCVLLAGPGGSGKSTLVAAAVHRGFYTVGEDFLVANGLDEHSDRKLVYSLFRTGKLVPSGPATSHFESDGHAQDGKSIIFLDERRPAVVASQEVMAGVSIRQGPESSLRKTHWREFAGALLPYSAPLTYEPMRLAKHLSQVFRELPLYEVSSGPNISETLELLERLLES